jgi:phosphoglycerate dehydrogenase-like enzyme
MAEHTLALLLTVLRKLDAAQNAVREGRWFDRPSFVGFEIKGKTIGIVGIGNIGTRVGAILKKGFDAKVIACDPYLKPSVIRRRGAEPASFKSLMKTADIISLNCSLNKGNVYFMNRQAFRLMKPGVILVNTARGELMEEKALMAALRSGKLSAYACDVVEGEPITDRRHPLLKLPNALVVPHIGAYTRESLRAMGEKVIQDVRGENRGEWSNPRPSFVFRHVCLK